MKKNGFTLIELIAVIAIVAAVSVLLGTNFMKLTGNVDAYEDKVIAKGIAEAAYIYFDSPSNSTGSNIISAYTLIDKGFISSEQGLLKDHKQQYLMKFCAKVEMVNNIEKKVTVFKWERNGNNYECKGTQINYED